MGAFSWEIGAGIEKNWFLTISPNENRDLLSISRQIMGHSPDLQHWEFNDSKPPKDWDRKFSLYDELMDERAIDASAWKFAVIEGEYGKVDVILEADNIQHLDYETTLTAGNLLVLGELGEELKIKKIGTIEVVQSLGQEYKEDKFDIADLREHFRSI